MTAPKDLERPLQACLYLSTLQLKLTSSKLPFPPKFRHALYSLCWRFHIRNVKLHAPEKILRQVIDEDGAVALTEP